MIRRQQQTLILVLSAVIIVLIMAFALSCFLQVKENLVFVGLTSDFPVSEKPYSFQELTGFLVHLDREFIFLSSRSPHEIFSDCLIVWDSERDRFMEPCGGSFFGLDGRYLGGPSPRSMDRYEVIIRDGELWVNIADFIPGSPRE